MKCTYDINEDNLHFQGISYIADKKYRSEVLMKDQDNNTIETYSINDGQWMYTWGMMENKGMKLKMDALENMNTEKETDTDSSYENNAEMYDKILDYKCTSWKADNNYFLPPTNIDFEDQTAIILQSQEMMKNMQKDNDLCGICEQIADEAQRDECKKGMGCE